jgi:hypothetical protein
MTSGEGGAPGAAAGEAMPTARRRVGHYEIIRQIGRGGMAIVYLARQEPLDRDVALKELSSFHASAPEMAERFLRESRLAGSLNHPNIVTVLEYFEDGGIPYIAMEYVRRGSLRPYVGRLSLSQFAGVMEGVLAGLAHAETYGIVHRDLKPENLMVTADGTIKIADFGIAKATQSAATAAFATATGTTVGTPTYMAPEQAMAQNIGLWTDLYSVGVMAWEHVVGRVPFHDSEAPMVILMRHVNEDIPSAVEVKPDADPQLSAWIDRLLVKDPGQRTRSPVAAWEDLEEIVIGELGPRWRREARLPSHAAVADTPRPLTPAPFESQHARTPKPVGRPKDELLEPAQTGYVTFGRTDEPSVPEPEARASAPAPEPQVPPHAEPPGTTTGGERLKPESRPPAPGGERREPGSGPPDGAPATPGSGAEPARRSESATYLTFGRAADPLAPVELAAPESIEAQSSAAPQPPTATQDTTDVAPERESAEEPASTAQAESALAAFEPVAPLTREPEIHVTPTPIAVPPDAEIEARPEEAPKLPQRAPRRAKISVRAAAAVAAAVLAAAAVGFVVAPSSGGSARATQALGDTAFAGPIELSYPATWKRHEAPVIPNLDLAQKVALGPAQRSGGVLVVGPAATTDPSLLPGSLLAARDNSAQQVITLSGHQFYRYINLLHPADSAPETVYALPTTIGTVIGVCAPQAAGVGFLADCERVLGALRLKLGSKLGLDPSPTLAAGLNGAAVRLNAILSVVQRRLSGPTPADQARAANELAAGYAQAATQLEHLKSVTAAAGAMTALTSLTRALAATGRGFAALARAAKGNDGHGYMAASASIASSTRAIRDAFGRLRGWGYVVS